MDTSPPDPKQPLPDAERRAALETLARLAAYTPPVLMSLMLSQRASAQSAGGGGGGGGGGGIGLPPPPP